MKRIIALAEAESVGPDRIGGKAATIFALSRKGFIVPETLCITTDAYSDFLDQTGLRERIMLELHRKRFDRMRWEEIWDAGLRIRNLFVKTPMPRKLAEEIEHRLASHFADRPAVVRSSAPEEDSDRAYFAGLHESFVNVRGIGPISDHIRKVWASLWSDAALLYRQEIGLDALVSTMAVVIQETVVGDRSGVVFTRNPSDPSQAVVESVHGLNQGLVDGTVEPDRWIIDRASRKIIAHHAAQRDRWVQPTSDGVAMLPLPPERAVDPPLSDGQVRAVYEEACRAESVFGGPQDMEWTVTGDRLVILQTRPVTTAAGEDRSDQRAWYLSLHRSFDNLVMLREKIERDIIPGMIRTGQELAAVKLSALTDENLAREIEHRRRLNEKWANIYWADCIPFAHGVRLFGQVYNDAVRPENPYEFVDLLGQTPMESMERNRMLEQMAACVRNDPPMGERLKNREYPEPDAPFMQMIQAFIEKFGDLSCPVTGAVQCGQGPDALIRLVCEMAAHPPATPSRLSKDRVQDLAQRFLSSFQGQQREQAEALIDLARASYRLRDDDNIHLGRIEAQVLAAVQEGRRRIEASSAAPGEPGMVALKTVLADAVAAPPRTVEPAPSIAGGRRVTPRQLTGQPAGPGLSRGPARVIRTPADLSEFRYGEVLVCDAVDPNMTYVVPLATAIVERRGGMLIHGAIIAREYGLPCVTGVPDVVQWVRNGDTLTVDGYLGIVTVAAPSTP